MEAWTPGVEDQTPPASPNFDGIATTTLRPDPAQFRHHLPHPSADHQLAGTLSARRTRANFSLNSAGVTLIEVMVSLIILTVGMLGIAALHGLGVKYGTRSYFRSQAVNQAYDILDRMRANPAGVSIGEYTRSSASEQAGHNCLHSSCSAADIAGYDLGQWNWSNSSLLPSGSGTVTTDGSSISVDVSWEESGHTGKTETINVRASARL